MKIGIYSRKSRYTEEGDSIDTQINLCKEYCKNIHDDIEYVFYQDEGWSGKSIHRPGMNKLMDDIENKQLDYVVVYRLDRISRSVVDFSNLVNIMNKNNVNFISIKEKFDTSTPMGRAMMYISSVFAQLESETIGERVADNMYKLAETGVWLGGVVPLGYKSVQKSNVSSSILIRDKKYMCLEYDEEGAALVKLIFDKYLEFNSLRKVSDYLYEKGYKTRRGNERWDDTSVSRILQNITYVKADTIIRDYLLKENIELSGILDGCHGIMAFGKDKSNEVYTVGEHIGFIDSQKWIQVQDMLHKQTREKRKNTDEIGLLRGLFRCGICGEKMSIAYKDLANGDVSSYYVCSVKRRRGKKYCDNKTLNVNELDDFIIDKTNVFENEELYSDFYLDSSVSKEIESLSITLRQLEQEADKTLSEILGMEDDVNIANATQKLEELDFSIDDLKKQIKHLKLNSTCENTIKSMNIKEKREVLKHILDSVTWDGRANELELNYKDSEVESKSYYFESKKIRKCRV